MLVINEDLGVEIGRHHRVPSLKNKDRLKQGNISFKSFHDIERILSCHTDSEWGLLS